LFALPATIKSVADSFGYASVSSFKKSKLYYLQASDVYIRLWSIQYISNGTYKFNREDKVKIKEDTSNLQEVLVHLLDFFLLR
ncbi:hypothetical protein EDC94DRAFT_522018, partial [Helicostylum pulchrum]